MEKQKAVKTFYFTFGFGQVHQNGFHKIKANSYGEARDIMVERFGTMWAFQYDEKQWFNEFGESQQEQYGLKEIK